MMNKIFAITLLITSIAFAKRDVLVWMCLERCDGFDLQRDLKELKKHLDVVTIVSFENYQVAPVKL